jgi:hypothetical protein
MGFNYVMALCSVTTHVEGGIVPMENPAVCLNGNWVWKMVRRLPWFRSELALDVLHLRWHVCRRRHAQLRCCMYVLGYEACVAKPDTDLSIFIPSSLFTRYSYCLLFLSFGKASGRLTSERASERSFLFLSQLSVG